MLPETGGRQASPKRKRSVRQRSACWLKTPKKAEEAVTGAYHRIEDTVVGTYRKIEDTVVGSYKKVERAFVDAFLEEHSGGTEGGA